MTVNVSKPVVNVREKLAELDKPTGIAGEAMLRAETPQEQFNLIGAGRRNLIINGDMRIAQRGTSVTGVNQNGYYTADRAKVYYNNLGQLSTTVSQDASGPNGFRYSHKVLVTTAETSIGVSDLHCPIWLLLEGQDLQHLAWGTSEAKPITLSFWVKSNVTGDYTVSFYKTSGGGRVNVPIYTINTADTWEYKTITISGDTVQGFQNTNETGLSLYFNALVGTQYTSGTEASSWSTYNTANWSVGQTAKFGLSTNDYWQITGVQLELGKVATPFEHRSYGEELALCRRYCNVIAPNAAYGHYGFVGFCESTTRTKVQYTFPVEMRASPTLTRSGTFNYDGATSNPSFSSQYGVALTTQNCRIEDSVSSGTTGEGVFLLNWNDADATITLDAEL